MKVYPASGMYSAAIPATLIYIQLHTDDKMAGSISQTISISYLLYMIHPMSPSHPMHNIPAVHSATANSYKAAMANPLLANATGALCSHLPATGMYISIEL